MIITLYIYLRINIADRRKKTINYRITYTLNEEGKKTEHKFIFRYTYKIYVFFF